VAAAANPTLGSATASTTPASIGPRTLARLSIWLIATFATLSCSGVSASEGRSAICAGPEMRDMIDATTARA
jgi:hypothetical protein